MLTTHFLVPRRNASPLAAFGWSDFDRVFDQLWNGAGRAGAATYAPRIDFTENESELRVAAELPGFEEKDLKVTLEDGVLTIEAERTAEVKNEEAKEVRHVETFHGKYRRALRLPSEVDAEAVKANVSQRHPHRDAAQGARGPGTQHPGHERLVTNEPQGPDQKRRRADGGRLPALLHAAS